MKAVVLCGKGQVEFREVPEPVIGDDDILLEVKACGICGSDLHFYYGRLEPMGQVPFIMGHEFAGVIAGIGKNVSDYWKIGDRVVSENTGDACGRCPSCAAGNFVACAHRQTMGCSMDGGFTK
ncbi:alcohol dehydrogenase catalytic domain-containing protein [Diplocloster agilis]|uniref:Alcohol dehydrogenase catalytic domain-containing protein n=2 Tax=Diplocloster agilis TaxID=2850323 RepID=A0A949JVZ1_9FIRM|nr:MULTISPECIES: alcohol dehydrogenase catalytic domain-containing protein [Lachnospiraceae]MBU9735644.1 alcohol dehydrogenase catalytic domain-containing protein [Diplocloster agilis]MCU6732382.1 alcohol dehydrogenase catalytic domain-containing protein [Suonthocola fibrivorans]SCI45129.1 Sorbitol dehydrogenase [uncultured Clostridium sp.]